MSSLTTKKAISYALKDLLKTNPFSKITINDIAASCNINRQTFYYHFLDKEDLVEWICKEEIGSVLDNQDTIKSWQEKFLSIFALMLKEKNFIINIYHSVSLEILRKNLYEMIYPIIYSEIEEQVKEKNLTKQDKVFIANFYKYAFVSIVLEWIGKGMEEDAEIIVNKVSNLVTGTIVRVCF